jgi:Domain of Unknown Function (DUF1206)
MDSSDVKQAASRANDHPALAAAARAGFLTSGVLHLLIGWITLQVAFGGGGGRSADQSGALSSLSTNGPGKAVLWLAVVGFLGLALWQLTEAVVGGPGSSEATDRAKAAGKAVVYAFLAWTSFTFARGGSSNSGDQTADFTASLMDKPGGRVLVVLIGLGILGVAAYHVRKGWKRTFLEDLSGHPGRWATRAGQVGYVGKGIALAVVGFLFVAAGFREQASQASGLDGALKSLRDQPFGIVLLVVIAIGFAAYGLYSFARAKYAKV